jgi:5-methylcytosine-specific restriction endonuclease McrA
MKYDQDVLRAIYAKTNGRCHICTRPIALTNYAKHGKRGGWEVDHSVPLARGGTDHLNNLLAAHTSCNRRKKAESSRTARSAYGKTRAPLSTEALRRAKFRTAVSGAVAGGMLGARIAGPAGLWIGAIAGALVGFELSPE